MKFRPMAGIKKRATISCGYWPLSRWMRSVIGFTMSNDLFFIGIGSSNRSDDYPDENKEIYAITHPRKKPGKPDGNDVEPIDNYVDRGDSAKFARTHWLNPQV